MHAHLSRLLFLGSAFALFSLFIPAATSAREMKNSSYDDDVLVDCKPTPEVKDITYYVGPDEIGRTNNLRRKTGIAVVAKGEPVYVVGRVVDKNCIPISDARVEMWQANTFGKYTHPADTSENLNDDNFVGSGFTKTDNLGQFTFLTIFPGSKDGKSAPRVHFRVTQPDFKEVYTEMYFPEQEKNYTDETLSKDKSRLDSLSATMKFETREGQYRVERIDGDMVYRFVVTMDGNNRFRRY